VAAPPPPPGRGAGVVGVAVAGDCGFEGEGAVLAGLRWERVGPGKVDALA